MKSRKGSGPVRPTTIKPPENVAATPVVHPIVHDELVVPSVSAVSAACTVKIGHVEGVARWMPVQDVLGLLPAEGRTRLTSSATLPGVKVLAERLRGSDGSTAPVVFTGEDGPEHIAFGYPHLAALAHIGISDIFVITVRPHELGLIQSRLKTGSQFHEIVSST